MLPTSGGVRKSIDIGANLLDLQSGGHIEAPNATLNEVGNRNGPQLLSSIFQNQELRGLKCNFEEINLSDNYIGDEGAAHLLNGLGKATACSVKKLFCQRAKISAAGFGSLGKLLAQNDSIEEMVLDGNPCGKAGLDGDFSAGLARNKTLRSLRLGKCRLGNEGVAALCAEPLKVHPRLEHLELMYNRIDVNGAKLFSSVFAAGTALRYLDLSYNALGPDGAVALAEGLKAGKGQLEKLSVACNMIKFEGTKALALYFNSPQGRNMEYLDLRFNILGHRGFQQMRQLLGRSMQEEECWLLMFGTRQLFMNGH